MSRLFFLGLVLLTSQFAVGQTLQEKVDQFAGDYALRHGNVSICVIDVAANQVVADYRAEHTAIPASALKAVTTATALALLGPDYRFATELQYDGSIAGGRLNGNLYIKGFGDPTLGSDRIKGNPDFSALFDSWVKDIRQKGIETITGAIIGDDTHFDSQGAVDTWQWADLGNYYAAGAHGLNIRDNQYTLYFDRNGQVGSQPRIIRTDPDIPWLEWVNEVRIAGPRTGDQAYIYGSPYTYLRYVRGTIPAGSGLFDIKGSIPDPALLTAFYLRQYLLQAQVKVDGGETTLKPGIGSDRRRVIRRYTAPPLREIVTEANLRSVNLYCEALIKEIGRQAGDGGSTEAGTEAVLAFWADRGVDVAGIYLADGSGLSARNAVSARFLAEIMRKVAVDDKIAGVFKQSLPRAGFSGNLVNKFRDTAAYGRLYAKSGTIGRVRSYTGYFTGRNDRDYAFAVLVNNYTSSGASIRRRMDDLLQSLCE